VLHLLQVSARALLLLLLLTRLAVPHVLYGTLALPGLQRLLPLVVPASPPVI
jgi:hypothetical protein